MNTGERIHSITGFGTPHEILFRPDSNTDPSVNTHAVSVIDAKNFKHIGDFTLPGRRSEAMAIDRAGNTMYVNLTDEVGIVDLPTRHLRGRWPVPDAHVQNAMALDEPHHRLFIATRNPPKLHSRFGRR